ncbi:MAG: deoxyribodipyrimidine photo-lyase [Gammaproteobacteria bacterium]
MGTGLLWLRRDLRLADNPALHALLDAGHLPIPLYIHDEPDPDWPLGAASAWWLHHSLAALGKALRQRGSDLIVLAGDTRRQLFQAIATSGAQAVYWNRCHEPAVAARDLAVQASLRRRGIEANSYNSALLREPAELLKKDGTPYRVFTPFWKALHGIGPVRDPLPPPDRLPALPRGKLEGTTIDALKLLPSIPWDRGFYDCWQPGENGARNALEDFLEERLPGYATARDIPDKPGTSRLSAHLHYGDIGPVQLWQATMERAATDPAAGTWSGAECWLRELGWREFSAHQLHHFPHTASQPLDPRFRDFPWRTDYADMLARWQQGRTGIPIVDAGMRELWTTGYMHNRVRMLAASFLCKNLLIPWQEGARWFWDTLVDADLASNTMGWQWTAGCGADAAPYFRIFNPSLQGERFDGAGRYVRRWVPELAKLEARHIHRPWSAGPALLADAGIRLGGEYPEPLVDLKASRQAALAAWKRIKRRRASHTRHGPE